MLLLSIVYVMMLHNAATAAELGRHRRGQAKYGGVRDDAVHEIIKELERNKKPKGHGRTHHRNRHTSIAVRQPSRAFDDECDKENDSKAGNTGDSRLTRESERFRSAENTLSSVEDRRLDVSSFANYMRSRNAAPLDRRRMKSSRHLDESKPASRRNLDVDDMKKPRTRQPIKDTPSWHKKKLQEQKEIQKKQERVLASFRRRHKKMRSRIQDVVEAVLKPYRIPVAPFGNVQPLNLINKGGFGEVHRCMIPVSADGSVIVDELDETTKADYKYVPAAMKSSVVSKGQRQKVAENEVQVLKLARFSPHLLQIIAEVATPPRFPLKNILVEIAEFGSLDSFLDEMQRENTQLSLPITISLITDMFQGVQELHEKRHLHCDITPGNFLLFSSGVAKLSDFGLSRSMDDLSATTRGSRAYMDPALENLAEVNRSAHDVYSTTKVALEILGRAATHDGCNGARIQTVKQLLTQVINEDDVQTRPSAVEMVRKLEEIIDRHDARQELVVLLQGLQQQQQHKQ